MYSNQILDLLNNLISDSDFEVTITTPSNFDENDLYKYFELIDIYREINLKIKDEQKRLYAFYLTDLYAELEGLERRTTINLITCDGKFKAINIEKGMYETRNLLITNVGNFRIEGLFEGTEFTYEDVFDLLYHDKTEIIFQNKYMTFNHWVDYNECPIFTSESLEIYYEAKFKNPTVKKYIEIMLKTIDICRLERKK